MNQNYRKSNDSKKNLKILKRKNKGKNSAIISILGPKTRYSEIKHQQIAKSFSDMSAMSETKSKIKDKIINKMDDDKEEQNTFS
jgi:hypothetical protein